MQTKMLLLMAIGLALFGLVTLHNERERAEVTKRSEPARECFVGQRGQRAIACRLYNWQADI